MATAKSTPADINEIQRRMAQIRRDLHEDVREVVKGAQSLTDWRSQVRSHPWLALGAAAALGYFVVPKRNPAPAPAIVAVAPAVGRPADPGSPRRRDGASSDRPSGCWPPSPSGPPRITPSSISSSGSPRSPPGRGRRPSAPGSSRGLRRPAADPVRVPGPRRRPACRGGPATRGDRSIDRRRVARRIGRTGVWITRFNPSMRAYR